MGEAEKPVGRHDHSKAFEKPNGSLLHIKAELIQSENNKGRTDEYDFKHEMLLAPGHQTDDISFRELTPKITSKHPRFRSWLLRWFSYLKPALKPTGSRSQFWIRKVCTSRVQNLLSKFCFLETRKQKGTYTPPSQNQHSIQLSFISTSLLPCHPTRYTCYGTYSYTHYETY